MANSNTLTLKQRKEAKKQERIIDDGLSSYVEVGFALRKIQDEGLHDGKFIDYATDRFALKKHTIYRLMRAAGVAKTLMDANLPCPKNAGQAHRLHDLAKDDPADQIALWTNVIESGTPVVLSQIDRVASETTTKVPPSPDQKEITGELDMDSVHHVEPIAIPPSDADPLPCLRRAAQEIYTAVNGVDDGGMELELLKDEIDRISKLIDTLRAKVGATILAA